MDSYSILGLAFDASPAEIKRAYRRLAMRWHPDRNTHPEATERFREIRAAFEALRDRIFPHHDAESAAPTRPATKRAAADSRIDLEIAFAEAAFGCKKNIAYTRGFACRSCGGSGDCGISRSRPCRLCHGSGRVRRPGQGVERCHECEGRGFISDRRCGDCCGQGRKLERVTLQVSVPAGMLAGDELRLAGLGDVAADGITAGDLYIRLDIGNHPLFTLSGRDLSYAMPVSVFRLVAGGRIEVPGLTGNHLVDLAPGDTGPRSVRVPGGGYPGRQGDPAGDLIVHLEPVMPRGMSAEQQQVLAQAMAACEESLAAAMPEIAAWRSRHGL